MLLMVAELLDNRASTVNSFGIIIISTLSGCLELRYNILLECMVILAPSIGRKQYVHQVTYFHWTSQMS